jgi:hypothetical protein
VDHAAYTYQPRTAEAGVLHAVVREHLEDFLRAGERAAGSGVPSFVEREFRQFLSCGVLARGFARVRCPGCAFERLVPFSCKGRGFCPSCGGRRMTERAAHLVDHVFPHVPVRQWVLTVPHRLRYLLAWDHKLCRDVLGAYTRALLGFQRRRARRQGIVDGRGGAVTVIQRFGSAINLNVHFHTLALDGVFAPAGGGLQFHPADPPSDEDVARLLATIRSRVLRLLARRGIDIGGADPTVGVDDPVADESPLLAGLSSAAIQGRIALGPRAGARVLRIGRDPDAPWVMSSGPRQAHLEGFDLHANLAVRADDRAALERLSRYVLRPPIAQARLQRTGDGRVLVALKSAWSDGTTHFLFEPVELLERLAVLTPRPRINLLVYHGILAPHAAWRKHAVANNAQDSRATILVATESPENPALTQPVTTDPGLRDAAAATTPQSPEATEAGRARRWTWANLMRRAFDIDVLACPRCGSRMTLIATIEDPHVIRRILSHLHLPTDIPHPSRPPPLSPDLFDDMPA